MVLIEMLLAGLKKEHILDYQQYVSVLLNAGVQRAVIVKLGPRGVLLGLRNGKGIEYHSYAALKVQQRS